MEESRLFWFLRKLKITIESITNKNYEIKKKKKTLQICLKKYFFEYSIEEFARRVASI